MSEIRVGFIGTGGIAGWHARKMLELPEVRIASVSDTSAPNREKFVEKFGLSEASQFADYHEMLAQSDVDAVVICSPHTLHFQQAYSLPFSLRCSPDFNSDSSVSYRVFGFALHTGGSPPGKVPAKSSRI
jgi:hypothetical protein